MSQLSQLPFGKMTELRRSTCLFHDSNCQLHAAGGNAEFKGVAGSVITKTFDLFVGKTGLDKQEALENGFDPVENVTRAGYYPIKIMDSQ